jgi:hypothetical protein
MERLSFVKLLPNKVEQQATTVASVELGSQRAMYGFLFLHGSASILIHKHSMGTHLCLCSKALQFIPNVCAPHDTSAILFVTLNASLSMRIIFSSWLLEL